MKYLLLICSILTAWSQTVWAQDAVPAAGVVLWRSIPYPQEATAVAFSPDEKMIVVATENRAYIYNENLDVIGTLRGHQGLIRVISYTPDGKTIVTGGNDATVRLWNSATGAPLKTLTGHSGPIHTLAFSPGGKLLASGSADTAIGIWDMEKQELHNSLKGSFVGVSSIEFSAEGTQLKSVGFGKANGQPISELRTWDIQTGRARTETVLPVESKNVLLSPGGAFMVRVVDGAMVVHNADTGEQLRILRLTPNNVKPYPGSNPRLREDSIMPGDFPAAFVPATQIIANIAHDRTRWNSKPALRLWDVATGEYLSRFVVAHADLMFIAPSGRMFATTGIFKFKDQDGFERQSKAVQLWRVM